VHDFEIIWIAVVDHTVDYNYGQFDIALFNIDISLFNLFYFIFCRVFCCPLWRNNYFLLSFSSFYSSSSFSLSYDFHIILD